MKNGILTKEEIENRRKAVKEAIGLNIMAGSTPPDFFYPLIEKYINGNKTIDDIRNDFEREFSKRCVKIKE